MRIAFQATPLLAIGFALIGCSKDGGDSDSQQGKVDASLPVATITIPDLT